MDSLSLPALPYNRPKRGVIWAGATSAQIRQSVVERDAEEAAVALRIGKVMTLVAMGLRHDNDGKCVGLVAVSDQLLSSTQSSTHLPFSKLARVGSSWVLGFSGDSSLLIPIRDELVAWEPDKKSSRELAEKATAIFKRYRTRSIEDIVLGPVGLDFATFISRKQIAENLAGGERLLKKYLP